MTPRLPYTPPRRDPWAEASKWGFLICAGALGLIAVYGAVFAALIWLNRWMGVGS